MSIEQRAESPNRKQTADGRQLEPEAENPETESSEPGSEGEPMPIDFSDLVPDLARAVMIRAKLEIVDSLLKALRKELHLEKPGEREALANVDHCRFVVRQAANRFPLRRPNGEMR